MIYRSAVESSLPFGTKYHRLVRVVHCVLRYHSITQQLPQPLSPLLSFFNWPKLKEETNVSDIWLILTITPPPPPQKKPPNNDEN